MTFPRKDDKRIVDLLYWVIGLLVVACLLLAYLAGKVS